MKVGRMAPRRVPEMGSLRRPLRAHVSRVLMLVTLAGLSTGCRTDDLHVRVFRPSWDTLVVAPSAEGLWGPSPDSLSMSVVDASGFVVASQEAALATGETVRGPWALPVADVLLPSRAPLMVDVCARRPVQTGAAWTCEQVPLRASPKRVTARLGVTYPVGGDLSRLLAVAAIDTERPATPAPGAPWTPLRTEARLQIRLTVDGDAGSALVAPLPADGDTLDLERQAGYDGFWFALQQRLFYGESARVHVTLVRADDPAARPLASAERWVRALSVEDRRAVVSRIAERARRSLAVRRSDLDRASLQGDVGGWRFDRLRSRYEIRLVLSGLDTLGRTHRWAGTVFAPEQGPARFAEAPTGDSTRIPLDFTFDPRAPLPADTALGRPLRR